MPALNEVIINIKVSPFNIKKPFIKAALLSGHHTSETHGLKTQKLRLPLYSWQVRTQTGQTS